MRRSSKLSLADSWAYGDPHMELWPGFAACTRLVVVLKRIELLEPELVWRLNVRANSKFLGRLRENLGEEDRIRSAHRSCVMPCVSPQVSIMRACSAISRFPGFRLRTWMSELEADVSVYVGQSVAVDRGIH
jgi:hypothetical protein